MTDLLALLKLIKGKSTLAGCWLRTALWPRGSFKSMKDNKIEKAEIINQLNNYDWSLLFQDGKGGFLTAVLPYVNTAILIALLIILIKK